LVTACVIRLKVLHIVGTETQTNSLKGHKKMLKNVIALAIAGFATLSFAQGTTPATPAVPASKVTAPAPAVAEKKLEAPKAAEPAKAEAKHEASETKAEKGEHPKHVKHEKKAEHEHKGEAAVVAPAAAPK
jgi:hypothetical protein